MSMHITLLLKCLLFSSCVCQVLVILTVVPGTFYNPLPWRYSHPTGGTTCLRCPVNCATRHIRGLFSLIISRAIVTRFSHCSISSLGVVLTKENCLECNVHFVNVLCPSRLLMVCTGLADNAQQSVEGQRRSASMEQAGGLFSSIIGETSVTHRWVVRRGN